MASLHRSPRPACRFGRSWRQLRAWMRSIPARHMVPDGDRRGVALPEGARPCSASRPQLEGKSGRPTAAPCAQGSTRRHPLANSVLPLLRATPSSSSSPSPSCCWSPGWARWTARAAVAAVAPGANLRRTCSPTTSRCPASARCRCAAGSSSSSIQHYADPQAVGRLRRLRRAWPRDATAGGLQRRAARPACPATWACSCASGDCPGVVA